METLSSEQTDGEGVKKEPIGLPRQVEGDKKISGCCGLATRALCGLGNESPEPREEVAASLVRSQLRGVVVRHGL